MLHFERLTALEKEANVARRASRLMPHLRDPDALGYLSAKNRLHGGVMTGREIEELKAQQAAIIAKRTAAQPKVEVGPITSAVAGRTVPQIVQPTSTGKSAYELKGEAHAALRKLRQKEDWKVGPPMAWQ